LGEIALAQAISPTATHFSAAWSVVCHIRAPCLNRSADLHAIWQVHLRGPMTHCVRWGFMTPTGRRDLGGWTPSQKLHLLIYDSPDGSTDRRFRLLRNNFRSVSILWWFAFADPPYFSVRPRPLYQRHPGQSVTMPCVAVGDPKPTIVWRKVRVDIARFAHFFLRTCMKAIIAPVLCGARSILSSCPSFHACVRDIVSATFTSAKDVMW